jgi:hypothetical protein
MMSWGALGHHHSTWEVLVLVLVLVAAVSNRKTVAADAMPRHSFVCAMCVERPAT